MGLIIFHKNHVSNMNNVVMAISREHVFDLKQKEGLDFGKCRDIVRVG